ncbi:MAG: hypothetical protein ABEJ95_06770 [Candidatus Nanohalobium sp.]
MSHGRSLSEKLEHSTLLDLLSIGVYIYFGLVSYSNLGYSRDQLMSVSFNPTVVAVQLAGLLVLVNLGFLLHDRFSGRDSPY